MRLARFQMGVLRLKEMSRRKNNKYIWTKWGVCGTFDGKDERMKRGGNEIDNCHQYKCSTR
jgi:hypothetical protein